MASDEGPATVKDFGNAGAASNQGFQVRAFETHLFHPKLDGLDRVGDIHWKVLILIGRDESCQYVQAIRVLLSLSGAFQSRWISRRAQS